MTNNHRSINYIRKILAIFALLLLGLISNNNDIIAQTVELYENSGTFTVPNGVNQITIEAWGGGGAGGYATGNRSAGGGGAGGSYARSIISVTPNTSYTIVVAEPKVSTTTTALNKGNSSYIIDASNVVILRAEGGNGGSSISSGNTNGSGGTGSTVNSIGQDVYAGGDGATGNRSSSTRGGAGGGGAGSEGPGNDASGGTGGGPKNENGGSGASGLTSNGYNGLDGLQYGGGGSGGKTTDNSDYSGGSGAKGLIRISYTIVPLSATATTSPSCSGSNPGTGSINIIASGGTEPYTYKLGNGNFQSSPLFTQLLSGTYSVTVKDASNTTFQLNNILVGSINPSMPAITADVIHASCGSSDGSITVTNIPTALNFIKSNSTYVDLGGSLLNNLSKFTLEGWIKIDKSLITGDRTWGLFGQNDAIEFGIMNSTTLQLWTANGGQVNISMNLYPDDNKWHHIAAVGTGTSLIVYFDGVQVGTTSSTTSNYGSSTYHSMIGGNIWDVSGNFFNGSVLKTSFWSRALSASEIQNLANTEFYQYSGSASGLIAGYNYFEGSGNTLSKVGSSPYNGTLANSPVWMEVFIYNWIKTGDASFSATTKDLTGIASGQYTLTSSFPQLCSNTGTWIVNSNGINTWTGIQDINWNNSANWSCAIPDLTIDAIIPSGLTHYPTLSTGVIGMCKNIQIQSGASVIVSNNTLQIAGSITNSGVFDATQGTIELKGTAAQIIPAASFSGNAVKSLTINNLNGVTLNGTLYVYNILKATIGTFQTNGFLTLLSTPTQTALIDGSGTGAVLGNVTMQRYLPSAFGYKYFSSPFTNATVAQYAQEINLSASFATMYYYIENVVSTGWKAYTATTGVLQPGTGYALNFGTVGTPTTVSVTGTVNNGTVGPVNLYNNNQPYTKGFNLVGNPYPSPIDWNASGWTKTNIDNALYYFDAGTTNQYLGTYSSYVNGVSSNGAANNVIASQQAFFIHVSDGAYPVHGVLTFSNSVRTNNLNPLFHKNSSAEQQSLIRLSASSKGYLNSDHMVIYLNEFATMSFDKELDALKLKNTDNSVPDLYVLSEDGREVSIKAIPEPIDTYTISLGFSSKINGTVMLKAEDILNAPSGYNIYLKDCYTGLVQDLASNAEYSFTSNTETTHDRFKIILSRENLSHGTMTDENFLAFSENGSVYVNLEVNDLQTIVQMTDLTGRMIVRKELSGEGKWLISAVQGKQVYVVSLFTRNGIFSKKVYVD